MIKLGEAIARQTRGNDAADRDIVLVEETHAVDRLRVRGQNEGLGVHERFPDDHLVGALGTKLANPAPRLEDPERGKLSEIDFDRAIEL